MLKHCKKATAHALKRLEIARLRIDAFDFAFSDIREYLSARSQSDACTLVRSALYRELHEAYQDLFMWTVMFPKTLLLDVRREIFSVFFRENIDLGRHVCGAWDGELRKELGLLKQVQEVCEDDLEAEVDLQAEIARVLRNRKGLLDGLGEQKDDDDLEIMAEVQTIIGAVKKRKNKRER